MAASWRSRAASPSAPVKESFTGALGEAARDRHDAAILAPQHLGGDRLTGVEDRLELVAHLPFEIRPHVLDEGPMPKADVGVRYQHIDALEAPAHCRHELGHVRRVRHVCLEDLGSSALGLDQLLDAL